MMAPKWSMFVNRRARKSRLCNSLPFIALKLVMLLQKPLNPGIIISCRRKREKLIRKKKQFVAILLRPFYDQLFSGRRISHSPQKPCCQISRLHQIQPQLKKIVGCLANNPYFAKFGLRNNNMGIMASCLTVNRA